MLTCASSSSSSSRITARPIHRLSSRHGKSLRHRPPHPLRARSSPRRSDASPALEMPLQSRITHESPTGPFGFDEPAQNPIASAPRSRRRTHRSTSQYAHIRSHRWTVDGDFSLQKPLDDQRGQNALARISLLLSHARVAHSSLESCERAEFCRFTERRSGSSSSSIVYGVGGACENTLGRCDGD